MIRKWYNTNLMQIAEMLDVTDDFIREACDKSICNSNDSDDNLNDLFNPQLWGDDSEDNLTMHYIELPIPVVNIQYLTGRKPVLSQLTGTPIKALMRVVYCSNYVVTECKTADYTPGQLITAADYYNVCADEEKGIKALTGAAGVIWLLQQNNVTDYSRIILNTFPVLPMCLRVSGANYYSLQALYNHLVNCISRVRRVSSMSDNKFPPIIYDNFKCNYQRAFDTMISNGANGHTKLDMQGVNPLDSLWELYETIALPRVKQENPVELDLAVLDNVIKKYHDSYNTMLQARYKELNASPDDCIELDTESAAYKEAMSLFDNVKSVFAAYALDVLQKYYPQYSDYHHLIADVTAKDFAERTDSWYQYQQYHDSACWDYRKGIKLYIDRFIAKQIKWMGVFYYE